MPMLKFKGIETEEVCAISKKYLIQPWFVNVFDIIWYY